MKSKFTEDLIDDNEEDIIEESKGEILKKLRQDYRFRSLHRPFSKMKRKLIFLILFFINLLINVDHGAIPAATTTLKRELGLDMVSLGTIGSLVYLGLVLGALSAGPIFSIYSSKWIIVVGLISSCFFLYFFTVAETQFPLALCRIGCGFFQVFCCIYFPVWVDQFGISSYKVLWLTFLQLGVPLGTMIGYVLMAYFINNFESWRACFYIQIFAVLIGAFLLILTPDKFFSKNYKRSNTNKDEIEHELDLIKTNMDKISDKFNPKQIKMNNRIESNKYGRSSQYSIFSVIDESDDIDSLSYYSILLDLFKNKVYLFTMLAICCLLFVVTGIQFWISDYMQTVLKFDPKIVFITFATVSITAPTIGVLAGGILIQKLGGYTNKTALSACFKISILAACSAIFLPLVDNIIIFVVLIWLLLFFGASIVPGLTGIMLSSTQEKTKEIAMSITHLCYNLIGYLPSPFLYGLVCKYTGGITSRYGLGFILLWSYFGVGLLFLSKYFKNKSSILKQNEDSKKNLPFEQNSNNHTNYTKDSSNDSSLEMQNKLEEKTEALIALYGRLSIK